MVVHSIPPDVVNDLVNPSTASPPGGDAGRGMTNNLLNLDFASVMTSPARDPASPETSCTDSRYEFDVVGSTDTSVVSPLCSDATDSALCSAWQPDPGDDLCDASGRARRAADQGDDLYDASTVSPLSYNTALDPFQSPVTSPGNVTEDELFAQDEIDCSSGAPPGDDRGHDGTYSQQLVSLEQPGSTDVGACDSTTADDAHTNLGGGTGVKGDTRPALLPLLPTSGPAQLAASGLVDVEADTSSVELVSPLDQPQHNDWLTPEPTDDTVDSDEERRPGVGVVGSPGGPVGIVGSLGGPVGVVGSPGGSVSVVGSLGGPVDVVGSPGGPMGVVGLPGGPVYVVGSPGGPVDVVGLPGGPVGVVGSPGGPVDVVGSPGGPVSVVGSRGGPVDVVGSPGGPVGIVGSPGGPVGVVGSPGGPVSVVGSPGGPVGAEGSPGDPESARELADDTRASADVTTAHVNGRGGEAPADKAREDETNSNPVEIVQQDPPEGSTNVNIAQSAMAPAKKPAESKRNGSGKTRAVSKGGKAVGVGRASPGAGGTTAPATPRARVTPTVARTRIPSARKTAKGFLPLPRVSRFTSHSRLFPGLPPTPACFPVYLPLPPVSRFTSHSRLFPGLPPTPACFPVYLPLPPVSRFDLPLPPVSRFTSHSRLFPGLPPLRLFPGLPPTADCFPVYLTLPPVSRFTTDCRLFPGMIVACRRLPSAPVVDPCDPLVDPYDPSSILLIPSSIRMILSSIRVIPSSIRMITRRSV